MTSAELMAKAVQEFFDIISTTEPALLKLATLGYCAIEQDGNWHLYSARVRLDWTGALNPQVFRAGRVRAGLHSLDTLKISGRALVEKLLSEQRLVLPEGDVLFKSENGVFSTYIIPHHRLHTERKTLATLKLGGARIWDSLDRDEIGWALRGAPIPYESLAEVCASFDAGEDPQNFEVVVATAVRVADSSFARNNKANLIIRCADGLDTRLCRLSYRVLSGATVVKRDSISGTDLDWACRDNTLEATCCLDVPQGAIVDCVTSYADATHHQAWVVDRTSVQNARRAAFESSDMELHAVSTMLFEAATRDKDGRAFESAIAWLFWMLGFNPAHLGNVKRLEEAPDLIVEVEGQFAVVECTIGKLKSDKISSLSVRVVAIREALAASGNIDAHVLPILVTQLSREEIKVDLGSTTAAEVFVLTRDELHGLFERTRLQPSAETLLSAWWELVSAAKESSNQLRQLNTNSMWE